MGKTKEPVLGQKIPDSKWLGGRPPKLTVQQKYELLLEFQKYIRDTDDPTLPDFVTSNEFALDNLVTTHNLQDWKEFSSLIKQCVRKQEAYLLKQAGAGKYNAAIAIFRLKQPQHGYKDRVDSDITSGGEKLMGVGISADQAEQLIRARASRSNI